MLNASTNLLVNQSFPTKSARQFKRRLTRVWRLTPEKVIREMKGLLRAFIASQGLTIPDDLQSVAPAVSKPSTPSKDSADPDEEEGNVSEDDNSAHSDLLGSRARGSTTRKILFESHAPTGVQLGNAASNKNKKGKGDGTPKA